ncbi:PREDICTED: cyclic AMP-responsive element-binding protein 3-like protein 4 [Priapulus caudatus]|uniref:Cyclic AMP-responsive element-binding protein 3-like protein 4 n=1 Tax=Priapulus caudatus TaxID=37621 RepID=A0ABM1DSC3_PRICU|nr:PREDICTED: cyclic AMP-responsive element-binding protein 3-like protein 4 [Priapulus caudatus]
METLINSIDPNVFDMLFDKQDGLLTDSITLNLDMPIYEYENTVQPAPESQHFDEDLLLTSYLSPNGDAFADALQGATSPLGSDSGISSSSPARSNSDSDVNIVGFDPLLRGMGLDTIEGIDLNSLDPELLENFSVEDLATDYKVDMDMSSDDETESKHSEDNNQSIASILDVSATALDSIKTPPAQETRKSFKCQPLRLNTEEKKLLNREGIALPENMPLTKAEERTLKRVRRKIRNKQSAQDSRKRKKEYVEGLEERVKLCTDQNNLLQRKVQHLEKQNVTLISQLKRLQTLVIKTTNKTAQASTCVMVLAISFALLLIPNFSPFSNNRTNSKTAVDIFEETFHPVAGRSRSLLQKSGAAAGVQDSQDYIDQFISADGLTYQETPNMQSIKDEIIDVEMLDEEEKKQGGGGRSYDFAISPSLTVLGEHSYSKAMPVYEPTPPQSPDNNSMEAEPPEKRNISEAVYRGRQEQLGGRHEQ